MQIFLRGKDEPDNDVSEIVANWQEFWSQYGYQINPSGIIISARREGFNRLLVIPQGLTNNKAYELCAKQFACWRYMDDLDKIQNDRNPDAETYTVWVRDRLEADEELKNLSANQIAKKRISGITLLEREVYELKYYSETKEHLDRQNWTLGCGSRDPGGSVPNASWRDDEFKVSWSIPVDASDRLRCREVVS
ncbi:MAG: hypothetical protein NTZ18_02205 [Candidatus Komeilibacteria bacterium]|nr:hypothetical protein [Candidatus Komeilibacteria bacterium]